MKTKLIELEDGLLVEVEASPDQAQQISGGFAEKVNTTFEKIQPILMNVCRPISAMWKELNQEMSIEQAQVELGLSFEGEGNFYITKSKAKANVTITLTLKPKE